MSQFEASSVPGAMSVHPVMASAVAVNRPIMQPIGRPFLPIIIDRPPLPLLPASLPMLDAQSGNLFPDRNDANLHWYLPAFALADDLDPSFAFVASQSGQQANGQPFNVAKLTLQLAKSKPADVVQFAQNNPAATLQEIPLAGMLAVLSSYYTDQNGQTQCRTFKSSGFQDLGNGAVVVTFDGSILGDSVVGLYQDLRVFGQASLNFSASFQGWAGQGALPPPSNLRVLMFRPMMAASAASVASPAPARLAINPMLLNRTIALEPPPTTPLSPPALVVQSRPWTVVLPLLLKYNSDGYQLRYTVSTATVASHVILSVNDLQSFNQTQSQFAELKALGDLNAKYPSISRAYFGVLSRKIVVVPQRYSVVRNKSGCAATCLARVDSSAASTSGCCFEFSFTIAPEVNAIEMGRLQQEIANNPAFAGYQTTFADFLRDSPPSTLQTSFSSSAQFANGADAHTFAVTVTIQDAGPDTFAVANANLFILRLFSQTGADLIGSLSLKLDDGYVEPIPATLDLNFQHTAGTDDMAVTIDEAGAVIKLTNQSPLDLQLSEYALIQGAAITDCPGAFSLPAGATFTVPLPADHAGLQFAVASQLVLPKPLTVAAVAQLLNFQTIDVQQIQYVVAVDGSGVNYSKVASVSVAMVFPGLNNVVPRELKLSPLIHADSTRIAIPLAFAIFTLPGTATITVQFVDPAAGNLVFTIQNDFIAQPILFLLQTDIDKHVSPTS